MKGNFAANPAYTRYEQLLIRLQMLHAAAEDENEEAGRIHDELSGLARRLSQPEITRLNGLSSDLYMLSGEELPDPRQSCFNSVLALDENVREARDWNQWDAVLSALRRRPATYSDKAAAFLRAKAYNALNHPEVALLFLDCASPPGMVPDPVLIGRLGLLARTGRFGEVRKLARQHLSASASPENVIIAAHALLDLAEKTGGMEHELNTRLVKELTGILKGSACKSLGVAAVALAYVVLIGCLEHLQRMPEAIAFCDQAARLFPFESSWVGLKSALQSEPGSVARQASLDYYLQSHHQKVENSMSLTPIAA